MKTLLKLMLFLSVSFNLNAQENTDSPSVSRHSFLSKAPLPDMAWLYFGAGTGSHYSYSAGLVTLLNQHMFGIRYHDVGNAPVINLSTFNLMWGKAYKVGNTCLATAQIGGALIYKTTYGKRLSGGWLFTDPTYEEFHTYQFGIPVTVSVFSTGLKAVAMSLELSALISETWPVAGFSVLIQLGWFSLDSEAADY